MKHYINQTKQYNLFSYDRGNRPLNIAKHRKLLESMKKYGFITSYPLTVHKKNGSFIIKDGQHRHAIAAMLELPVYYVEIEQNINIPEINSTAVTWSLQTYIDSFAQRGFRHYLDVIEFRKKYKIPLNISVSLLAGKRDTKTVGESIKSGKFKVTNYRGAHRVALVIARLRRVYPKANSRAFVYAIVAIYKVKGVDMDRLITSIEKHPDRLFPYGTTEAVVQMLEGIYNFGRRNLYPLVINVKNAAKKK